MLYFDYPLSERVRNFVRIGQLGERFDTVLAGDNPWLHHVAVCTLFELSECASRADLKRDLLHELERQRMQQNAQSEPDRERVEQLNRAIADLQAAHPQSAQSLRENEWLTAFKQRLNIPGSTTAVELPSYHYWLNRPAEQHREYLQKWIRPTLPVRQAVSLVLENLYKHTQTLECEAKNGVYQHGGLIQTTQLLRIGIAAEHGVVPEVSANKYLTNISFFQADQESMRSKVSAGTFPFQLMLCSFDAK